MRKKLKEIITSPTATRRMGDFICNFVAVVLGIIITFVGNNIIEEHNKQKELKEALLLVKDEMMLNRENIKKMMQQEIFEQTGARYLLQHRYNMDAASPDSLKKYGSTPFSTSGFLPITDAMEMLKTSSLISTIKDKKLATRIIQTYNTIKGAHLTFESFTQTKKEDIAKLYDMQEVKEFMTNHENTPKAETWKFYFKFPEGIQAIKSIAVIHDSPARMYGRYIKQIDETIAALNKMCK